MTDPWDKLSRDYLTDKYPEAVAVIDALVAERDEWRDIAPDELGTPGLFRMYVDVLEEANSSRDRG